MNKQYWFKRHSIELTIMGALIFGFALSTIMYFGLDTNPTIYSVGFYETPSKMELPAGYTARFWVEDDEPRVAITYGLKILDEWRLELGNREGNVNGWKEAWRIWIDIISYREDLQYIVQFRFQDVHYT